LYKNWYPAKALKRGFENYKRDWEKIHEKYAKAPDMNLKTEFFTKLEHQWQTLKKMYEQKKEESSDSKEEKAPLKQEENKQI
jgi:hypothetical protein